MTTIDTRKKWCELHDRLTEEAEAFRDSQSVSFGLLEAYDTLTSAEKAEVHEILEEWLASDDNKLRYDAKFLASQRQIVELGPAIERTILRIEESSGPEAKFEVKKLRRILSELS